MQRLLQRAALDGQQLHGLLSLMGEETLPGHVVIGHYDDLHVPRGSQAARSRLRLLRQDRRACGAPPFGVSGCGVPLGASYVVFFPGFTLNCRNEIKHKSSKKHYKKSHPMGFPNHYTAFL